MTQINVRGGLLPSMKSPVRLADPVTALICQGLGMIALVDKPKMEQQAASDAMVIARLRGGCHE